MAQNFLNSIRNLSVNFISKQLVSNAKQFSESRRVRETIKSTTKTGESQIVITLVAGGPDARDAGAREYGSGKHATRGPRGKYPIVAKNAPLLVFEWDKSPTGWFRGKKVMHPGIQADNSGKGYLRPAVTKTMKDVRVRLVQAAAKGIRLDIQTAIRK